MGNETKGTSNWRMRLYFLRHGRVKTTAATEESVHVKALKRQIVSLEGIIDKQGLYMDTLTKQVEFKSAGNMQEELLSLAKEMFVPNINSVVGGVARATQVDPPIQQTLPIIPRQVVLNDVELKEFISGYPTDKLRAALALGDDFVFNTIQEKNPNLAAESINKGIELAKVMVNA